MKARWYATLPHSANFRFVISSLENNKFFLFSTLHEMQELYDPAQTLTANEEKQCSYLSATTIHLYSDVLDDAEVYESANWPHGKSRLTPFFFIFLTAAVFVCLRASACFWFVVRMPSVLMPDSLQGGGV